MDVWWRSRKPDVKEEMGERRRCARRMFHHAGERTDRRLRGLEAPVLGAEVDPLLT
jgi:hypothetical protein